MGYVTVAEVRAQGLSDATAYPDPMIQTAIDLASAYIDKATRQWFTNKSMTILLDGQDSARLFLPIPIVSVSELYINARFDPSQVLPAADYIVYNGRSFPDDRKNPKIQLNRVRTSIYQGPPFNGAGRLFVKAPRNTKIVGVFGYTEADDTTPLMIKRATMKMTLRFVETLAPNGTGTGAAAFNSGILIGESTDGHFIQFALPSNVGIRGATFGISKDPEVEQIILLYKAPLAIAVPGNFSYSTGLSEQGLGP